MYLMALVNSTFVGRRPTGHVELVDLSVDQKKGAEQYKEQNGTRRRSSAEVGNLKPSSSPRARRALTNQSATDLSMEPLFPLFLGSPSSDSSEADTALRVHPIPEAESLPCSVPLKDPSVNMVGNTLEPVASSTDLPGISDKQSDMKEAEPTAIDGSKTIKPSKSRSSPKLGSLFSDGGVSTRVQRHPLEMIAEQELDGDSDSSPRSSTQSTPVNNSTREKLNVSARVLQHPLARIDESPVKVRPTKGQNAPSVKKSPVKKESPVGERKLTLRKERKPNSGAPSPPPQPSPQVTRKPVRDPKPDVKPGPPKRERAKQRAESKAPIITKPRSQKPGIANKPMDVNDQEKPSLANPVMEKMPQIASPEPAYAWNKKLQNLPKLAVSNNMDMEEPVMEERELRYSSPKMTESDAQDDLSFRVWERESKPKRKSISVSLDFQDSLDLESSQDMEGEHTKPIIQAKPKPPPAAQSGKTAAIPNVEVDHSRIIGDHQESETVECPSPSSFTCGMSPKSLFSDDDNMFSRFQQFSNFGPREVDASTTATTTFSKSPRSVLSQEHDEISHFASDSSIETRATSRSAGISNDDSSDLGETEFNRRSFSTFTYTDKDESSSEDEDDEDHDRGAEFSELRYFREAGSREPWLGSWKDGGPVLDDTDLEFLLAPDFKDDDDTTSIPDAEAQISEPSTSSSPRSQKSQTARRHSRSSSFSKSTQEIKLPQRPAKRSVKFAPDLVREISNSTPRRSFRLPRPEPSPARDDDEQIYPSVKSWEVKEDDNNNIINTSTTPIPRRRWRRAPKPSDNIHVDANPDATTTSSRRRWRRSSRHDNPPGKLVDDDARQPSRRRRRDRILPCAGRLFSRLAFKVSRRRRGLDSDGDESVQNASESSSFGRSARRDAQQVRRIIKGSQKKFSHLTVADILDDNFASQ